MLESTIIDDNNRIKDLENEIQILNNKRIENENQILMNDLAISDLKEKLSSEALNTENLNQINFQSQDRINSLEAQILEINIQEDELH